ncbi:MAG: BPSS1780 family membrane protein [Burkholderiaceae bacterium]
MSINVIQVPASEGIQWLRRAWAITRANPLAVHAGMFSYLLLVVITGIVPVLGQFLPLVAVPVLYVGLMSIYRAVARKEPLSIKLIFSGLSPKPVAISLLIMGVIYAAAILGIFAATSLVDDGLLMRVVMGEKALDPKTVDQSLLTTSAAFALMLYVPVSWLFWMAPQFVAWHGMGVGKALFYSLVGCWRNISAFILFFATAGGLLLAAALTVSLIGMLLGGAAVAQTLMLPLTLLFGVVVYVAFYASYESMVRENTPPPLPETPESRLDSVDKAPAPPPDSPNS